MRSGEVEISQEQTDGNAAVRVRGTVSMENSPALRNVLQRLVKGKAPAIIVCFEGTDHVDTSGLATLVECSQNMQVYGGRLLVAGLNSQVADAYSLSEVEGAFSVFDTEAEAAAALKGHKPQQAEVQERQDAET